MIDAHTHLGLFEDGVGTIGDQGNEFGDPNTAYVRAMDAIFPKDMAFEDARKGGVIAAGAFPGSAESFRRSLRGGEDVRRDTRRDTDRRISRHEDGAGGKSVSSVSVAQQKSEHTNGERRRDQEDTH